MNRTDLEVRLSQALNDQASHVREDTITSLAVATQRLRDAIDRSPSRAYRVQWLAPVLAAAVVLAVVAGTVLTIRSLSGGGGQQPAAPPPAATATTSAAIATPTVSSTATATATTNLSQAMHRSAPTAPPATYETSASENVAPQAITLGPDGLGALKLGMTRTDALKTGKVTIVKEPAAALAPGCVGFDLIGHSMPPNQVDGYISDKHGVVSITGPAGIRTPEGIGVGSTLTDVERAYPGIDVSKVIGGGPSITTPGNPNALYELPYGAGHTVTSVSLISKDEDCFD